jgi:hypothetical protein
MIQVAHSWAKYRKARAGLSTDLDIIRNGCMMVRDFICETACEAEPRIHNIQKGRMI